MIWFDCTKAAKTGHHSGLQRVSNRLRTALGTRATATTGSEWVTQARRDDWFLTAEVFAPSERAGWSLLLQNRPCRLAAIFHDAIPLKFPHTTWPQSVARHPAYLKMLAGFDQVLAVSEASKQELLGYWAWLGLEQPPPVEVINLGADFDGSLRVTDNQRMVEPVVLGVGILEPRKNQTLLLHVSEALWLEGHRFELHLVGRVNPHFGQPILRQIQAMRRQWSGLHYHSALADSGLARLYARARLTVFSSLAEGCGLPVLESLWCGVPCLCSDLPSVRENAAAGGTMLLPANDLSAWQEALRMNLQDEAHYRHLISEATARKLPTWRECADSVAKLLAD